MKKETREYLRTFRWDRLFFIILFLAGLIFLISKLRSGKENIAVVTVQAVEVEPKMEFSDKTQECIDRHPDVAERIKIVLNNDYFSYDLICRESSYNPLVINKLSGACGLGQAYPCSKMKCDLADIDCQLEWINDYVVGRYGSFENAIKFHNQNNWY